MQIIGYVIHLFLLEHCPLRARGSNMFKSNGFITHGILWLEGGPSFTSSTTRHADSVGSLHRIFSIGFIDLIDGMTELTKALALAIEKLQLLVGVVDSRESYPHQS